MTVRVALVMVAIAALGAVAAAGSKRPEYVTAAITTADHPSITYCVVTPASGTCAKRVLPPWRPADARGKRSIKADDTLSGQSGACCYVATWPHAKPAVLVEPGPREQAPTIPDPN